jgi:TDG/mug DNA glycosylase family protein
VPQPRRVKRARRDDDAAWSQLRLTDRIGPGLRVLFVGINPGVRSALTGHHFAGPSNRFWKLLFESRLVPQALTFMEDVRLPEFGFGITNLVARPSPGIDDLKPAEYLDGWEILRKKIREFRPAVVALVGVTLYRAIRPLVEETPGERLRKSRPIALGFQPESVHGARLVVLPNPSGRNANFSYAEMLAAFTALKRALER